MQVFISFSVCTRESETEIILFGHSTGNDDGWGFVATVVPEVG